MMNTQFSSPKVLLSSKSKGRGSPDRSDAPSLALWECFHMFRSQLRESAIDVSVT